MRRFGHLALGIGGALVLAEFFYPLFASSKAFSGPAPVGIMKGLVSDLESRSRDRPELRLPLWSSDDGPLRPGRPSERERASLAHFGAHLRTAPGVVGRRWALIGPRETVLESRRDRPSEAVGIRKDGSLVRR